MSVDLVDILTPCPPLDLSPAGGGHACIDVVGVVLVAPPFACLAADGGGHECIDVVGVVLVAPPFACLGLEIDPAAELGLEATMAGPPVVPPPADLGLGIRRRKVFIFGNGGNPPYGGPHSIPQPVREGTMSFVLARKQRLQILKAWKGVGFLKSGSIEVHLFTNAATPVAESVPGDFVEPTGSWYAALTTAALKDPVYDNQDDARMTGDVTLEFLYGGTDPLENVKGYYLVDGNGDYAGAELFAEDEPMGEDGDAIQFTLQLGYPDIRGACVEDG